MYISFEEAEDISYMPFPSLFEIIRAFKYRDRAGIVCDILSNVRTHHEGRKKTQIMQSANLNYIQTVKYLDYMVTAGFLMVTQKETYIITAKGHKYLQMVEVQGLRIIR